MFLWAHCKYEPLLPSHLLLHIYTQTLEIKFGSPGMLNNSNSDMAQII